MADKSERQNKSLSRARGSTWCTGASY
jgi:hypothetical protein